MGNLCAKRSAQLQVEEKEMVPEFACVQPVIQNGGTCYAHACASAFQSVALSIYGLETSREDYEQHHKYSAPCYRVGKFGDKGFEAFLQEQYDDYVNKFIQQYGKEGAVTSMVLDNHCKEFFCNYSSVDAAGVDVALRGNPMPRVVVMSFRMPSCPPPEKNIYWSEFFNAKKEALTFSRWKAIEEQAVNVHGKKLFTYETGGHAVAIVAKGSLYGSEYWVVRNSWGQKFGAAGYCLVSATETKLHKAMQTQFFDVRFRVDELPSWLVKKYDKDLALVHEAACLEMHHKMLEDIKKTYPDLRLLSGADVTRASAKA